MASKRKKSKKQKQKKRKASKPREKESDLNKLKKTLSDLYVRVNENLKVVLIQTQMNKEDLSNFIKLNGYQGLKKLPNLKISEPILDEMIKTFSLYDRISGLVTRMQHAENTVFISEVEKKTIELETKAKQIEKEDSFYTELGQDGFYKLKEKWHSEKDHWEKVKAEAQILLQQYPNDENALAQLTQAQRELDSLGKKKNWARMKNLPLNISSKTQKVSKYVKMIQNSVGEITKPFAEIGGSTFEEHKTSHSSSQKKEKPYKNQFEDFFGKVN